MRSVYRAWYPRCRSLAMVAFDRGFWDGGRGGVYQDKAQDVDTTSTEKGGSVPTLEVGTNVYVRNRYLGQWSGGFEVAEVFEDGYRLHRVSDGYVFPDVFPFDDVRP